ncbi:hypothetical protein IT575_10940 [bacterium]|nr:hypothetical protein [bacterium]
MIALLLTFLLSCTESLPSLVGAQNKGSTLLVTTKRGTSLNGFKLTTIFVVSADSLDSADSIGNCILNAWKNDTPIPSTCRREHIIDVIENTSTARGRMEPWLNTQGILVTSSDWRIDSAHVTSAISVPLKAPTATSASQLYCVGVFSGGYVLTVSIE